MFHSRPARKVRAYRPRLEVLESRTLLSTYLVDHLADDMIGTGLTGSLRYCITNAVDGDAINFGVAGTINLTGALPNLTHSIDIEGPGAGVVAVNGSGFNSAFRVDAGRTVTISGLTITGGFATFGGGIDNHGRLTVSNCTISHNLAGGDEAVGGGIFNAYGATLTISNTTIAENEAIDSAGNGSGEGGGIANSFGATLTVSNSTISANTANGGSDFVGAVGGIFNGYGATLTVSNSTISGNSAPGGAGGIFAPYGTLNMRNSIVARNTMDDADDLVGHLTSSGYNLIGNTMRGSGFDDTDLVGGPDDPIDPLLGPLQDNGGPTQTMALLPGSPALNAGDPAQSGVPDQRGVVRRGGVNIGAYQASASAFLLTAPNTVTSGTPFDVTVKAVDVFGQVAYGYTGTVTFSTSDRDPNVVLPANYTFTASDQGSHTFSGGFTLMTSGNQTLTATDAAGGFSGSSVVTVNGGGNAPGRQGVSDAVDAVFAMLFIDRWEPRGLL
jgi:hypothetical protein